MSYAGWTKFAKPTPPERGSFPLDHEGECKKVAEKYMQCLKQQKGRHADCRELAKAYLECRMANGLMKRDEFVNLGFHEPPDQAPTPNQQTKGR